MLADTHCHLHMLDLTLFNNDMKQVIQQANQHDVKYFLNVATELADTQTLIKIAEQFENVWCSVGLHPNEIIDSEPDIATLVTLIQSSKKIIAVGETGLDYYRSEAESAWQISRFETHIAAAKQTKKPLIIHSRQARADTIAVLKRSHAAEVGGIFHCFTEDWEMAKQGLDLGFYISFSGIITFKNATALREVAAKIPLDRLLIETDCPYLAPEPFRGKPNQPAYVRYVAEAIAKIKNVNYQEIAHQTTQNFLHLFFQA